MEIILKAKVKGLGSLGEKVNVKSGYARNFLIPGGKAVQATAINIAVFEKQKAELMRLESERQATAKIDADKINGKIFTVSSSAGEGGKLFGSIGTKEIADVVAKETGVSLEKKNVRLPEGVIRKIGEYDVSLHLYTYVNIEIKVIVLAEA